jgi:cytochrome c biogenesis protein
VSQDNKSNSGLGSVWKFFSSVKLSFSLLLIMALTSIAGTLIPQKEPAATYVRGFGESGYRFIHFLGLDDMYHAPWFVLIMTMLAANLVICSLDRLPTTFKLMKKDPKDDIKSMRRPKEKFTLSGAPGDNLDKLQGALAKRVGAVHQGKQEGSTILFAQKGAWSRMGVYVVHLSVLVILVGALVGNFFGFSGSVNITEGETIDQIMLDTREPKKLGFSLKLNKFKITFYDSGVPSEYRSDVTFIKDGKPVKEAILIVNDPAEFMGIDFYQASYGNSPKWLEVKYTHGHKTYEVKLPYQKWKALPDGGFAGVRVLRENVRMGQMYKGPAARILYRPDAKGETKELSAFKAGAKFPSKGPVKFEILKAVSAPYSGLSVKYDPGVWFIWVGCSMMVLGFLIAFYFSHRKVWLRLTDTGKGRTRVEIAGATNKNRPGLGRLLSRLAAELKDEQRETE